MSEQKPAASSEAVAQRKRSSKAKAQWVRAVTVGYYGDLRRRVDAEFTVDPDEFAEWMVAIDGQGGAENEERTQELRKAVNSKRIDKAVAQQERFQLRRARFNTNDPELLRKHLQAEAEEAEVPTAHRTSFAHPDTGSAPSSGIGTNLNPAPYGAQKVQQSSKAQASNKNVI